MTKRTWFLLTIMVIGAVACFFIYSGKGGAVAPTDTPPPAPIFQAEIDAKKIERPELPDFSQPERNTGEKQKKWATRIETPKRANIYRNNMLFMVDPFQNRRPLLVQDEKKLEQKANLNGKFKLTGLGWGKNGPSAFYNDLDEMYIGQRLGDTGFVIKSIDLEKGIVTLKHDEGYTVQQQFSDDGRRLLSEPEVKSDSAAKK